jgi:hypothetical protein
MGLISKIVGIPGSLWQLGLGGPKLKNNGGNVDIRNAGDNAYVNARGLAGVGANDFVTLAQIQALTPGASVGLAANRPVATGSGKVYYCTDAPLLYVDDPTAVAWIQFVSTPAAAPVSASSYGEFGNLAIYQLGDSIRATTYSSVNSISSAALTPGSLPQASPWTVDLCASFNAPAATLYPQLAVVLSAGAVNGTSVTQQFQIYQNGGTSYSAQYTTATLGGARIGSTAINGILPTQTSGNQARIRFLNDGTNLHMQFSNEGFYWWDTDTIASVASLDHYGFGLGGDFSGDPSLTQAIIFKNSLGSVTVPQSTVTNATNASPIVMTTSAPHQLLTGDWVAVHGVVGNTNANTTTGGFGNSMTAVLVTDSTHFQLVGRSGSGAYVSGGTVTLLSR